MLATAQSVERPARANQTFHAESGEAVNLESAPTVNYLDAAEYLVGVWLIMNGTWGGRSCRGVLDAEFGTRARLPGT
jgi:hypothetical protein